MTAAIIPVVEGELYALAHPFALDGRVSTHARDVRGHCAMLSYLLVDGDQALLIDPGMSVHERGLIDQLDTLVGPTTRLSVYATRLGEYSSTCNVRPIVEHFDVERLYGTQSSPEIWSDFRPEYSPYGSPVGGGGLSTVASDVVRAENVIDLGHAGRQLRAITPPLRLLPTLWHYDDGTRTLFTSDAFTHVWRARASGPWEVDDPDDVSAADIHTYLTGNRFWWLAGAHTDKLQADIANLFEELDVENLAPGWGCVLRGRDVVERHVETTLEVLAELAREPARDAVAAGTETAAGRE